MPQGRGGVRWQARCHKGVGGCGGSRDATRAWGFRIFHHSAIPVRREKRGGLAGEADPVDAEAVEDLLGFFEVEAGDVVVVDDHEDVV
jgi:hypothetical protein